MTAWLFICMTGWIGRIANAAHVTGLLIGAAIAYAPIAWRKARRQLGD
jgi:membrane associated rhomboid family serine protease